MKLFYFVGVFLCTNHCICISIRLALKRLFKPTCWPICMQFPWQGLRAKTKIACNKMNQRWAKCQRTELCVRMHCVLCTVDCGRSCWLSISGPLLSLARTIRRLKNASNKTMCNGKRRKIAIEFARTGSKHESRLRIRNFRCPFQSPHHPNLN